MCVAQIRHPAAGFIIKFDTNRLPATQGLRDMLLGTPPKKVIKVNDKATETPSTKKPVRLTITHGKTSAHASNKKRFEEPRSQGREVKGRNGRRMCKYNDGRKAKGFKPSRETIRGTYLH